MTFATLKSLLATTTFSSLFSSVTNFLPGTHAVARSD
jgi:hypothetical protein